MAGITRGDRCVEDQGGGGPGYPVDFEDAVEHLGQMSVGGGDDTAKEVACACGAVDLDHLRDRTEMIGDVAAAALCDLERDECRDDVADGRQVDVRPESHDDALRDQLVEACLDGVAGNLEPPGQLDRPGSRGGGERLQQPAVCTVQRDRPLSIWLHELASYYTNRSLDSEGIDSEVLFTDELVT